MVLLSFSIPGLEEKILSGEKRRTMRPVIKNGKPNQKWLRVYEKWTNELQSFLVTKDSFTPLKKVTRIPLSLWWKSRSKTNRHKIMDTQLTNITKKKLGDLTEKEWKTDGFNDGPTWTYRDAGLTWFARTYKIALENNDLNYSDEILNFEVYIIEW